jgi:DNA-binding transcriptional LysR family regulator
MPVAEAAEAQVLAFLQTPAGADTALSGTVRLAVPETVDSELLVPELHRFHARSPQVRLEFDAGAPLVDLARREADLALRFVRPPRGDLVALKMAELTTGVWGTKAQVAKGPAKAPWVVWDFLQDISRRLLVRG